MAQNPGFPQCLQSVNIPLLPFLLYVVTRLSLLFSLFIDLMCVHIIVRVCTCMCGSQRLASDILLITIFGDKVSLNSELPSLSRLNWLVKPGDPPISTSPKLGLQKCAPVPSFLHVHLRPQVRSCCLC